MTVASVWKWQDLLKIEQNKEKAACTRDFLGR
jgi:hypothetical protein